MDESTQQEQDTPDPDTASPADRLELLETIVAQLLGAHGETYPGAGEHLERLRGHIDSHH